MPLALFFFLSIALDILGLLWFHINVKIICSSLVKSVMSNLVEIVLNMYIALGSMASLTIINILIN